MFSATRTHVRWYAAFLTAMLIVSYGAFAVLRPLPAVQVSPAPLAPIEANSLQPFNWPAHGQAAVSMTANDTIYTSGIQKPVPTASVAKIMTALAVLKTHPLARGSQGPRITMTANDVMAYKHYSSLGGSVIKVTPGEQFTEYQMLQGLLLPSANNFADTLATWAFGSIDAYTSWANATAKSLGMTQSAFTDPSGFSPTTVSTASDMVRLGTVALRDPIITEIVAQKTATLPLAVEIKNVNWLLGEQGIFGLKTGNSNEAAGCYLFAATHQVGRQSVTVVGAILGDVDLQAALNDTIPLLTSARANIINVEVVHAGQVVGTAHSAWGTTREVIASNSLSFVKWSDSPALLHATFTPPYGTVRAGQPLGSITIRVGNDSSKTVSAVLASSLASPSLAWRLTHPFN